MYPDPVNAPLDSALPPRPAVVRLPVPTVQPLCTRVMIGLLVLVWLATTVLGFLAGYGLTGRKPSPCWSRWAPR